MAKRAIIVIGKRGSDRLIPLDAFVQRGYAEIPSNQLNLDIQAYRKVVVACDTELQSRRAGELLRGSGFDVHLCNWQPLP